MLAAMRLLNRLFGVAWRRAGAALLAALLLAGCIAEAKNMSEFPFPHRQKVPPLPQGLTWLNTAGPLALEDLRGKFVLIDFWTYCCINCMHILPELKKLEHAHPKNLVVIGVHSAKFETERDSQNIAEAIRRYRIEHPVINDADHVLWDRFGVSAWPTLLLIDPEGYAVWGTGGEITFAEVDKVLQAALPHYRQKKLLDETPLRFDVESQKAAATPLSFPGKILTDEPGDRLFIADSNHNRIVVARLDGSLPAVIGSGAVGQADGDFATAQFNQPQGMALRGALLFVADTENHLIRRVDLDARQVTTVAGLGRQSREPAAPLRRADPRKTALSSPWDLCLHGDDLLIAMAGCHQIWKMRLDGSAIGPYAGNGREDIVDGPLLPRQPYQSGFASFAQPSGLSCDGTWLYVADSEGSSIRAVPLDPREEVRTVVGTSHLRGARLFTFGDLDGPAPQVRLQHPLGVVYYQRQIYVADTYNHKIKTVDPQSGATRTLAGTGKPGRGDEPASFAEPAGLTAAAGKLFVADTNNHLIRVVDLQTGKVSTLAIAGLKLPQPPAEKPRPLIGAVQEKLKLTAVRPENRAIRLAVDLQLPPGYKINPLGPMAYRVEEAADSGTAKAGPLRREAFGKPVRLEKPAGTFEIRLPVESDTGRDTCRVALDYYYCRSGAEGLCKVGSVVWLVPLELSPSAQRTVIPLRHVVR
jgi:thiol-disulfide isomerase/thioredoxin